MNQEIVDDIRTVAKSIGKCLGDKFSRSEYLSNGARYSYYDLYDGGTNFSDYCKKAGFVTKAKEHVPEEIYLERLANAFRKLGRLPKTSERKNFGLNVDKLRFDTLVTTATLKGIVNIPNSEEEKQKRDAPRECEYSEPLQGNPNESLEPARRIPPIPEKTKRKKWERTGVEGFPYAPQDESGVIALFAILCSTGKIPWQILDLNSGKGIDAIVHDDKLHAEVRVELKHTLSKNSWNHSIDSLDCVVCWENRWKDFPKRVIELRSLVKK